MKFRWADNSDIACVEVKVFLFKRNFSLINVVDNKIRSGSFLQIIKY